MSNRSSSHQHGLSVANIQRPKSKLRKRRNKVKARVRSQARQAELKELLAKAAGTKPAKKEAPQKAAPKKAEATPEKANA